MNGADIQITKNQHRAAGYLVYIAGLEVPAISVTRTWPIGQLPTLDVAMVPDPVLTRFGAEDKVPIVVFYLDTYYCNPPQFCLYFDGYIRRFSFQNTADGRAISFSCVVHEAILDKMYPSYVTDLDSQVVGALQPDPAQLPMPHSGLTYPAALLINGVNPGTAEQPNFVKRPFDLLENVLKACAGKDTLTVLGAPLSSSFFTRYTRRVNMFNRMVPSPLLETDPAYMTSGASGRQGLFPILEAVQNSQCVAMLQTRLAAMGEGLSFWGTLQALFNQIFYEILVIPSAPMVQVNLLPVESRGTIIGPPQWSLDDKSKADIAKGAAVGPNSGLGNAANSALVVTGASLSATAFSALETAIGGAYGGSVGYFQVANRPNRLVNCVTKPQAIFGMVPMCNVIFPSMLRQSSYDEDYDSQPTRIYVGDDTNLVLLPVADEAQRAANVIRTGYPQVVQQALENWGGSPEKAGCLLLSTKNFLIWPEEYFRGPVSLQEPLPDWFSYLDDALRYTAPPAASPTTETIDLSDAPLTEETQRALEAEYARRHTNTPSAPPVDATAHNLSVTQRAELRKAFAHYEFIRARGMSRRGGAVTIFNPYIVPGFPCMVFDGMKSGMHVQAYVVSTTDTMTPKGAETSVSYAFAQTLDEYLHELYDGRLGNNEIGVAYPDLGAGPPLPINCIRKALQEFTGANRYYKELFYQNTDSNNKNKTPAFDIRQALDLVLPTGERVHLTDDQTANGALSKYSSVASTTGFDDYFGFADASMRLVARPICTLEEYINFHRNGTREGVIQANDVNFGKGARYYVKIMDYSVGPGDGPPAVNDVNVPIEPFNYDLRTDWISRLRTYRYRVLFDTAPQEV